MNATHLSTELAVLAAAAALGACGGSAADNETTGGGERTVVARPVPPATVTVTQTTQSRLAAPALAAGLPPLRTAEAARRECQAVASYAVAMTHGGATNDLESISVAFARAARPPGCERRSAGAVAPACTTERR